jgi:steroid delta-isomerase-like uncharacterized protein
MSVDENRALDRRYVTEVLDQGNLDAIDELMAPDYVGHVPGYPPMSRADDRAMLTMLRAAFPDLRFTIEDQIADGDRVMHRLVAQGTHTGAFMGVPPTGRRVTVTGMNVNRIVDGRIAEAWGIIDMLGLLQQIGAIPTPPPPAPR